MTSEAMWVVLASTVLDVTVEPGSGYNYQGYRSPRIALAVAFQSGNRNVKFHNY